MIRWGRQTLMDNMLKISFSYYSPVVNIKEYFNISRNQIKIRIRKYSITYREIIFLKYFQDMLRIISFHISTHTIKKKEKRKKVFRYQIKRIDLLILGNQEIFQCLSLQSTSAYDILTKIIKLLVVISNVISSFYSGFYSSNY